MDHNGEREGDREGEKTHYIFTIMCIYVCLCMHIIAHSCSCSYNHFYSTRFLIGNNVRMLLLALSLLVGINGFDNTLLSRTLEVCTHTHTQTHCPIMPHLNWSSMVLYNRLLQVLITCNDRLIDLIDCLLGSCQRDRRRGSIPISCSAKRPFHVPLAV